MKHALAVLTATAVLCFGAPASAVADDVAVIVHRSNPVTTMTIVQLRAILLAGAQWTNGSRIKVVMTPAGQPERSEVIRIVCGMSETNFNLSFVHGWRNRDGSINSGGGGEQPTVLGTGALVRQSVATTPHAVGFINASQVDDSVKVVSVDGSRPGEPAYKLRLK